MSFWTPVCLAALHRYDRDATARRRCSGGGGPSWRQPRGTCRRCRTAISSSSCPCCRALARLVRSGPVEREAARPSRRTIPGARMLLFVPVLLGYSHDSSRHLSDSAAATKRVRDVQRGHRFVAPGERGPVAVGLGARRQGNRRASCSPDRRSRCSRSSPCLPHRPLTRPSSEPSARPWLRRSLAVLAAIAVVAGLLPFLVGRSKLTIGGIRVVSIGRADTPLLLASIALLAWLARCRRSPRRFDAARRSCSMGSQRS